MFEGAFQGWYEFFSYGIPNSIMICSEFWIFEVITVMAGRLNSTKLATVVIVQNLVAALYENASGLASAITSLIGRYLGQE